MKQTKINCWEKSILEEKELKYKGTARINLEYLYFPPPDRDEQSRINFWKDKFREFGGCCRLDAKNHASALVSMEELDAALSRSKISIQHMQDQHILPPDLKLQEGHTLQLLNGRDKIQAAKETLHPLEKWWVVDLYLTGMAPGFLLDSLLISRTRFKPQVTESTERKYPKFLKISRWRNLCKNQGI